MGQRAVASDDLDDVGPPVPGWALNALWEDFGDRISPNAAVSVVPEPLDPRKLHTVMGESVVGSEVSSGSYYVFFVDQMPDANWAHECAYAFIGYQGGRVWVDATWPPQESVELRRIARP